MLVLIKITYCRDGQLLWLQGHFEKAAFSGEKQIYLSLLSTLRQMLLFQPTNAGAPKKRRGYPDRCLSGGLAWGCIASNLIVKYK